MATSSTSERVPRLLAWPLLIAAFFVPAAVWALSGPMFSVPDEPAHTVKAMAVWHGQLSGTDHTDQNGYVVTTFQVPAVWQQAHVVPTCFAFQRNVTADCSPSMSGSEETAGVTTTAGHYPPLYYSLLGWAGRLFPRADGVYLMRLVSALVSAVFLAWAVRALARVTRPSLAVAGVLAAATPMVWFLAGAINPNGFEITTSVAVWAHVLAIVRWREASDEPLPRSLLVGLLVTGAALAFTRSLSPPYLVVIVALALLSGSFGTWKRLLRERAALLGFLGLGAIAVAAFALVIVSGHLTATPGAPLPAGTVAWREVVGMTDVYVLQMIAWFGWLDTREAQLTVYLWLAVVFTLIGVSLVVARLRENFGLLATVAATIAFPIVLQTPRAAEQGLAWQGRYVLPIAVGIPLLAVLTIDRHGDAIAGLTRRLAVGVAALLGVGNLYALWWNLRRYTVGGDNDVNIFTGPWQPPFGSAIWLLAMTAFAIAAVAATALLPDRPPAPATFDTGGAGDDPAPITADPPDTERIDA